MNMLRAFRRGDEDDSEDLIEDMIVAEFEVDSDGQEILSENYLIRSYIRYFYLIKETVNQLDYLLESDPFNTHIKDLNRIGLLLLEGFLLAGSNRCVNMLLKRGSQCSEMESILQMHSYATTEVDAIKAKIDALGLK